MTRDGDAHAKAGNAVAEDLPNGSEREPAGPLAADSKTVSELQNQVRDLTITNRVKDELIKRLDQERESFALERERYVERLIASNRKVGELETRLLQPGAPQETTSRRLEVRSQTFDEPATETPAEG